MKQLKKILSNLPTTLCESNFNDFEYLMILKNKCIKKKENQHLGCAKVNHQDKLKVIPHPTF